MDPYKILGVPESRASKESDLDNLRKRSKLLFKRFKDEKNKFDAKKVLEAFEIIKQKIKHGELGKGDNKILGRSRKERDLDKHYNHQNQNWSITMTSQKTKNYRKMSIS